MVRAPAAHCVVFLGKTLYSDFLTPPRCKWVPDPVKDWGRQRQRGRGDGRRPHYAGPVTIVMVIPLPFFFNLGKPDDAG